MSPRQEIRRYVLVVDGDPDTLQSVSDQLVTLGFEVVVEKSAASCLSRAEAETEPGAISGILLELQSPALSDLTRLIQNIRDRRSNIPVIVMSDAANIARLRRAVELGAREYLVKPFDAELLKRKFLQVFRAVEQAT